MKIQSKQDLFDLYENVKDLLEIRKNVNDNPEKYHISVCGGTGCSSSSSLKIVEALKHWAKEYKVEDKVEISITGCFGFCERGPIVKIFPDHIFYTKVTVDEAERIIRRHICNHDIIHHCSIRTKRAKGSTSRKISVFTKNSSASLCAIAV